MYLAARHAAAAALLWCLLVALILAVSFIEGSGALGRDAGGAEAALWLSVLSALQVGWQLVPVAVVLGLVVATTQLARSGELLGLLALGTSPRRLGAPFVAVALVATAGSVVGAEQVLPPLARLEGRLRAHVTRRVDARTRAYRDAPRWFRVGEAILYLPRVGGDDDDCFRGPTVYLRRQGRLQAVYVAEALTRGGAGARVSEAASADPTGLLCAEPWQLHGAQGFAARPGLHPEAPQLGGLPRELHRTHGPPGEHGGAELRALIHRREAAGLASRGHRLEAQHRRAQPALGLCWVALALPHALHPDRKRSLVAGLGATAVLVGLGLAVGQMGRLLVHAGVLSVTAGCWLAPALACALTPLSWWWAARRS